MSTPLIGHREIETKLEVPDTADWAEIPDPTTDPRVAASGVSGSRPRETFALDAQYYDTESLDLLASRVTLRRRTGGHDAGWHLKLPAREEDPRASDHPQLPLQQDERREWHIPFAADPSAGAGSDATAGPEAARRGDRAARSLPTALLRAVIGTARGRWIGPVARLLTERTVTVLQDADGTALLEIADDRVSARRYGEETDVNWREVEVELLDGTADQLRAVVAHLVAHGATVSLRPSKVGTVLTPPTIPESALTLAGRLLRRSRDSLVNADRSLRMDVGAAAPQAFSAIRSARAVLELLGAADRPAAADLHQWERVVSGERDVQVGRALLLSELTDTHVRQADQAHGIVELELNRRERRLAEAIETQLNSPEHFHLLQDWDELADGAATPLIEADQLEERIDAIWHDLQDAVDAALSDPEFSSAVADAHVAAVLARDCLRALLPEFVPDAQMDAEDAVVALDTVIAALAVHRDARKAATLVEALADDPMTDGPVGFVLGRLYALMISTQHSALEDFGDVWDELGETQLPISVSG